jgi:hypothetical protein
MPRSFAQASGVGSCRTRDSTSDIRVHIADLCATCLMYFL